MNKRFIPLKNYKGIRKDTKSGKLQARKYINGKEYSEVFDKVSEALNWRNTFHPDINRNKKSSLASGLKYKNGVEESFLMKDIWSYYEKQHLPSITLQSQKDVLKRAGNIIPDFNNYRMIEINAYLIDEVLTQKISDLKYANQSRRHSFDKELKTLKAVLNWYKENYDPMFTVPILKRHFVMGTLRKKSTSSVKKMNPNEVKDFFDCFEDQFWKDFALIHFFMAGRVQEPAGLQIENVDLTKKILKVSDVAVWGHNKRFSYLKEVPKNGSERLVHLNDTMVSVLIRRLNEPRSRACEFFRESNARRLDFVFQVDGQPLNYRQIQYQYNKALKRAGLYPSFKATHILRKAMANIVRQNLGLEAAQAVGGWKSREVVERVYTDNAPSELNRSAVNLVEELIN